jgi:signal transduction histidine kinase
MPRLSEPTVAREDPMPTVTSTLSRPTVTGRPWAEEADLADLSVPEARRAEGRHAWPQVLRERARIAREIHDILAHTLGSMFVQLEAADALLSEGGDADRSRLLLREARRLATEGLEETRRAIAALRTDPVALPAALAALTKGNGRVSQRVRGIPRELHPDAGLALYRTAQEALANARKHAPGAPVTVTLAFEDQVVVLRVTNPRPDGAGGGPSRLAATGGGYGLPGLRERAELVGGTLRAGPAGDDWVVELRVPA